MWFLVSFPSGKVGWFAGCKDGELSASFPNLSFPQIVKVNTVRP